MNSKAIISILLVIYSVEAPPPRRQGCLKPLRGINLRVRADNMIDLTYDYDERAMHWPGNPAGFQLNEVIKGFIGSFYVTYNMMTQPEHIGTHVDAPSHFAEKGLTMEQVDLFNLIGNGVLLDLKNKEGFDSDAFITVDDFLEWERENKGRIRSGSIVLLYTGHGDVYYDRSKYVGTNITGEEGISHFRYPGLHPSAAEWLVTKRCIAAVGIDTASLDQAKSTTFGAHTTLSAHNIPIFENIANLDKLATSRRKFNIIALPQKIAGGSGAPVRVVAVMN
uniref:kynurenine formamidase-like n=1 Tax=Styela clava TaxID=7725 RepID=UPI00193A12DF|nr:kynurenine formamidase-like [Styela clava]